MDCDDTQVLLLSESFQSDEGNNSGQEKKLVAHLKVCQQKDISEKVYPVYEGETLIGRDPEACNIYIPIKALSKQHACIEVKGESHLIYDKNSRNKTRKGKLFLKPEVRYSLGDGDDVTFADVRCLYTYFKPMDDDDDMTDSNLGDSPLRLSNNNDRPPQEESISYELGEDELSSDILGPAESDGLLSSLCRQSQATQLYVAESDNEDETTTNRRRAHFIAESDQSDTETEMKKDVKQGRGQNTLQDDLCTEDINDNENMSNRLPSSGSSNEIADQSKVGVAPAAATDNVTDFESVNDTLPYDMDLDDTQTGSSNPVKQTAQIDVIPDSQSLMATQSFEANEGSDSECCDTQTFKGHLAEETDAALGTDSSTVAAGYSSDDVASPILQNRPNMNATNKTAPAATNGLGDNPSVSKTICTTANNESEKTQTLTESDVAKNSEQTADTQVLKEDDMHEVSECSEATQVIDGDATQITEPPDATEKQTEDSADTQTAGTSDGVSLLSDGNVSKICRTGHNTEPLKEDDGNKTSEATAPTQPQTDDGEDGRAVEVVSGVKRSITSEVATDSDISNKTDVTEILNNSARTEMLRESDGSDKLAATLQLASEEAMQSECDKAESGDDDTSEIFIPETQPTDQLKKGVSDSQGSTRDNRSFTVAETPIATSRDVAFAEARLKESTENLDTSACKETAKPKCKTREEWTSNDVTLILDDSLSSNNEKDDVHTSYVTSPIKEHNATPSNPDQTLDATLILESAHAQDCQPTAISPTPTVTSPASSHDQGESKEAIQDLDTTEVFDTAENEMIPDQSSANKSQETSNNVNTGNSDLRKSLSDKQTSDKQPPSVTSYEGTHTEDLDSAKTPIMDKMQLEENDSTSQNKSSHSGCENQLQLLGKEEELVANTQAYGEDDDHVLDTQPYGDKSPATQLSASDAESTVIRKSRRSSRRLLPAGKTGATPLRGEKFDQKDKEVEQVVNVQSLDEENDDFANTQPYSAATKLRRSPRKEQPNKTEARQTRKGKRRKEAANSYNCDDGEEENEESQLKVVKSSKRNQIKPEETSLATEPKSGKTPKKGRKYTMAKGQKESELVDTSDVDSTLLKTGTSNHRKTGDDQADCMDTEQAEMAMMVKDDDMNKQQLSKHDKSPVVVLKPLQDKLLCQEKAHSSRGDHKTVLPEGDEPMASTQAYSGERGDVCDTQPYGDQAASVQLSPNGVESPEIRKSRRSKRGRKKGKQTKNVMLVEELSSVDTHDADDSQIDKDKSAGVPECSQAEHEPKNSNQIEESSQTTGKVLRKAMNESEAVTTVGNRRRGRRKAENKMNQKNGIVEEAVQGTADQTSQAQMGKVEESLTLSEPSTDKVDQTKSTRGFSEERDEVASTQPYGRQSTNEGLSLANTKSQHLTRLRRSKRSARCTEELSQTKRSKVSDILPGVDVDKGGAQKGRRNKNDVRGTRRQAKSDSKNTSQNAESWKDSISAEAESLSGPSPATDKTNGSSDKTAYQQVEMFDEPIVLLEKVDSSVSSIGEQSFSSEGKTSDQNRNRSNKYSKLRLRKRGHIAEEVRTMDQTSAPAPADVAGESQSLGTGNNAQLKRIKQESEEHVGADVKPDSVVKTRKRKLALENKSHYDTCGSGGMVIDNLQQQAKKERLDIKVESEVCQQSVTETVKTTVKQKRSMRRQGKIGEVSQERTVASAAPKHSVLAGNRKERDTSLTAASEQNVPPIEQMDIGHSNEKNDLSPPAGHKILRPRQRAARAANCRSVSKANKSPVKRVRQAKKNASSSENPASDEAAEIVGDVCRDDSKTKSSPNRRKSFSGSRPSKKGVTRQSSKQQTLTQRVDESNAKRPRSSPKSPATPRQKRSSASMEASSPSLRKRALDTKPSVIFTGVHNNRAKKIVTSLGGTLATSMNECTHLVTDNVRRTVKFLCAVAKGIPIVSPLWLESCKSAGFFMDASHFLIEDKASEKLYKFNLASSLKTASEHKMLDGYKIHVTKSVVPDAKEMKEIITSAGGEFLAQMPTVPDANTVIISCPKDQAKCKTARNKGVNIVTSEFLLTGVLQQIVDMDAFRL